MSSLTDPFRYIQTGSVNALAAQSVSWLGWKAKGIPSKKGNPVDPIVIASYLNAGLSLLANGAALANQVLYLALTFL